MLALAPQTISPAVSWKTVNLKPYTCVTMSNRFYITLPYLSPMKGTRGTSHYTCGPNLFVHFRVSSNINFILCVTYLLSYLTDSSSYVSFTDSVFFLFTDSLQCMAHSTARSLVSPYLSFSSYLILRLCVPLLVYVPLSVNYALVSVAFKLPFGGGGTEWVFNSFPISLSY